MRGRGVRDAISAAANHPDFVLTATPIYIGYTLVLFLALWPTRRGVTKLLRRHDPAEPTDTEIDSALRQLFLRRLPYPAVFLGFTIVATGALLPYERIGGHVIALVVATVGLLLAEVITWVTTRGGARLQRQPVIPWWTITLAAAPLAVLALLGAATLLGQGWAVQLVPQAGTALAIVAVAATTYMVIIWLVAHRPPVRGPARIDSLLRARAARFSVLLALLTSAAIAVHCAARELAFGVAGVALVGALAASWQRPPQASSQPAAEPARGAASAATVEGPESAP